MDADTVRGENEMEPGQEHDSGPVSAGFIGIIHL